MIKVFSVMRERMGNFRFLLGALPLLFLVLGTSNASWKEGRIWHIDSNTTLTSQHDGVIIIEKSGVTLNLAGNIINASSTDMFGILISGKKQVTIRNGSIKNAQYSILAMNDTSIIIDNIVSHTSCLNGITFISTRNSSINYCSSFAKDFGIRLEGQSNGTSLQNSLVRYSNKGVIAMNTDDLTMIYTRVTQTKYEAAILCNGKRHQVAGSINQDMSTNDNFGLVLDNCDSSVFSAVNTYSNNYGLYLKNYSTSNTFFDCKGKLNRIQNRVDPYWAQNTYVRCEYPN